MGVLRVSDFLEEFRDHALSCGFEGRVLLEMEHGAIAAWERKAEGKIVYVSAGMHGDEPAGVLAILEMIKGGLFVDGIHWLICPVLNPNGLELGTRENLDGMDLNRDYLKRESKEVRAHVEWIDALPVPDLFISLHEDWETDGFYFYEINLGEDHPERARNLLGAVRGIFPAESGPEIDGHEIREDGWIYHSAEPDLPDSWPEAIYLAHKGCPLSFTFETPSKRELDDRILAHVLALRTLVDTLTYNSSH